MDMDQSHTESNFQKEIVNDISTRGSSEFNGDHVLEMADVMLQNAHKENNRAKNLIDNDELSSESGVNPYKKSRWRVLAVIISWLSIVATLAIGISEFIVAKQEDSSAAFGLAFDAILDVLTSSVVLWRYYSANDTFSQAKEHLSCVVLGILFLVSAIGIAAKAIFNLLDGDTLDLSERGLDFLMTTTSVAAGICAFLFVTKIVIAKKLSSWTMFSDALNSLMGGIIALSLIITVQVTESNPYLWYLDPTVGLGVSLFLLLYGLWLMVKHAPQLHASMSFHRTK